MQDRLLQFKKRQNLLEKGLEQIAKMQNLSQNKLNQITKMQNQSRDKLEQIAEMGRIKNYGIFFYAKRRVNNSSFKIKTQLS